LSDLHTLAEDVMKRTLALGADEVGVGVSEGSHTTLQRRGGKVETATEASTRGLVVSIMANGKWSSHSTGDLRRDALDAFLKRGIAATGYLEEDPNRLQADPKLCGRGSTAEELDQLDPAWNSRTAGDRAGHALSLEKAVDELADDNVISSATYSADGWARSVRVMSNGFSGEHEGAWFSAGGEMTLRDGEKRPEAYAYYGSRYLDDLPSPTEIAAEIVRRAKERVDSGSIESGSYPMILANRATGRILGVLGGPLAGGSIFQKRSCLADKLGESIGSTALTLVDDPTLPRGLSSRPWDGDALRAKPRTIIDKGVLKQHYIGVYYGRKLEREPTTGGRSNWVLPTGDKTWKQLAAQYPKAILVNGFLGGNSNGTTGDFSFGIRGVLLENGEPTSSLSEMNVSGNILEIFHKLVATANDPWKYSSVRSPTLVFEDVQFSGR